MRQRAHCTRRGSAWPLFARQNQIDLRMLSRIGSVCAFVRALAKVVRVERRLEDGSSRMGGGSGDRGYDVIRGENRRA
jgi:hypothetical protein